MQIIDDSTTSIDAHVAFPEGIRRSPKYSITQTHDNIPYPRVSKKITTELDFGAPIPLYSKYTKEGFLELYEDSLPSGDDVFCHVPWSLSCSGQPKITNLQIAGRIEQ